ncbi:MAG: DEAD/DEAH box helicase [Planctomycetota bacterium]|nr:MAG: DEAD/DEAH box helicase [Planctomycetota bacterium]
MTLSALLKDRFRGDIRYRGESYVDADRVSIVRVTPKRIFAVVRDGIEYHTQLDRSEGPLRMHCSCAAERGKFAYCKHLWGTILAAERAGFIDRSFDLDDPPPFLAPVPEPTAIDLDLDDEEGPSAPVRVARRRSAVKSAARTLPAWERILTETLVQQPPSTRSGTRERPRERDIFYQIDLKASRERDDVIVEVMQRQRRATGQWGKLKPLRIHPTRLDEIELLQDRRILAFLTGGTPERSNWHTQQTELTAAAYRFFVPFELCELIFPLMSRTGRFRYAPEPGEESQPLQWDDGPPYELMVSLPQTGDGRKRRLYGELVRGDERIPLETIRHVIPGGLVFLPDRVARLSPHVDVGWFAVLSRPDPILIPVSDEHRFIENLFRMPAVPRLDLPDHLRLEEVRLRPRPRLLILSPRSTRWRFERLHGEVTFLYDDVEVPGNSPYSAVIQRERKRCLLRDSEAESEYWSQLQDAGFRRLVDFRRGRHDVEIDAASLPDAARKLLAAGWEVLAENKPVREANEIHFRVESGVDWFELKGTADFGGAHVSLPELLAAVARGDRTVRLDDGSLGLLPEEWIDRLGLLAELGQTTEEHVQFSAAQAGILDALLAHQPHVDFDETFARLREQFRAFAGVTDLPEPEGFRGTLRAYQRQGFAWLKFLQQFGLGGCLADDMGLGKTVQLLALLQDRANEFSGRGSVLPESAAGNSRQRETERRGKKPSVKSPSKRPSLIVVPRSLLFNWRQELQRFTPHLKVIQYTGLDRGRLLGKLPKADVVLTTYGTLRRDALELRTIPFDYVVLDEAQTIKNAGSQTAKAARVLSARHRVALSGTPIENHIGDLWSIFEFLNPGMLGRSTVFRTFAAHPEREDVRRLLAAGLRPFILRRTKAAVASELPDRIEQTIYCEMPEEQRRRYDELRDYYRESLLGKIRRSGLGRMRMHVLEALLRLRQAACHPALLDESQIEQPAAKLEVLLPYLEELIEEDHKALVFSTFTSFLAIVRRELEQRGIRYAYLDGQTRRRKAVVEQFQNDPDCRLFLISLKAGGLGLNLTAADYVFLLDPWWNPAAEAQAIDRAHRVGQTRHVMALRLITRDTVEEKISQLQEQKKQLAEAILQESRGGLKDLSVEDIELLFS